MSAPLPRSDPYVDTILLECGRPNSEELKADPTNKTHALFTNKLGNGVKLNVGDKISVSSAFVSDRGCGGSVIEFKGVPVPGETYTLTETTVVKSQFPRFNGADLGVNPSSTQFPDTPAPFPDIGPLNCHKVNHNKTTKTFQLQDNEVSYEQTFYKTTNGQGYFHLPRRWDLSYPHGQPQSIGSDEAGLSAKTHIPQSATVRDPYQFTPEALGQGAISATGLSLGEQTEQYDSAKNGRACISPDVRKCCPADWYLYAGINSYSQALDEDGNGGDAGDPVTINAPGADGGSVGAEFTQAFVPQGNPMGGGQWQFPKDVLEKMYRQIENDDFAEDDFIMKQKNDNSRYTIYAKDVCHYAEHIADLVAAGNPNLEFPKPLYEMPENLAYADASTNEREHASRDDFRGTQNDGNFDVSGNKEPSLSGYSKYQEIKTLKVPKGYNSPANVAETITNQLNATKNQRTIKGFSGPFYGPGSNQGEQQTISNWRPGNTPETPSTWAETGLDQRVGNQLTDFKSYLDGTTNKESNQGSTINTTQRQVAVSTILESETLKSFACANMESYSRKNFITYRGQDPGLVGTEYASIRSVKGHDYPAKPNPKSFVDGAGDLIDGQYQFGVISDASADKKNGFETKSNAVGNIQYMSAHQYIGVKRPDLFDSFRDFYANQVLDVGPGGTNYSWRNLNSPQCLSGIPAVLAADCPFITTTEWTPENLLRYAKVFDAQEKYNELFDGYSFSNIEMNGSDYKTSAGGKGVSSDHMRFLHLNSYYGDYPRIDKVLINSAGARTEKQSDIYVSTSGRQQLGDDNIQTPLRPLPAGLPAYRTSYMDATRNAVDFSSHPMFVWYDQASKDNTDNDGSRAGGDLAYGCMFKFTVPFTGALRPVLSALDNTHSSSDYFLDDETLAAIRTAYGRTVSFIGFKTQNIGGLPPQLFTNKTDDFYNWEFEAYAKGIPRPSRIKTTTVASDIAPHSGCGCGFDIHFNAYGTSCIALYSGYLAGDKYAVPTLKGGADLPVGVTGEFYYDRGMPENAVIPTNANPVTSGTYSLVEHSGRNTKKLYTENEVPTSEVGKLIKLIGGLAGGWTSFPKDKNGTPLFVKITKTGHDSTSNFIDVDVPLSWSTKTSAATPTFGTLVTTTYKTFGATCISKFIKERYVGANQPLLDFDDKGERFNFQQLHTPIYIGNEANSGDGLTAVSTTAGEQVLEINRRLMGNDFTPEMMPYQTPILHDGAAHRGKGPDGEGTTDDTPPIQAMNTNLIPWQVYDSDGGVFMEGFGLSADQWAKSLWGVLGFSYEQFHPTSSTFNRQTRINNTISTDGSVFTTNANLEASDLVKFRGNRYGSSLFTNQPPLASVNGSSYDVAMFQKEADYPVISIVQTSAQVSAQDLPRKMLRPFFLVKSNILGDMNYFGGGDSGVNLPIVCVVNKENGFGDFYFQRGFDLEFTVTIPKVLTSITTSIHDPDMRLSTVTENSGIIYKITKMNHANLDVVQDVLQTQQTTMMRHAEMLKIAQEEQIREQVRKGDQAGIGGGTLETVADPRDGSASDPNLPVEPGGADVIRQRMDQIRSDPTFVNPGQVSAGQFEDAVAGLRTAMATGARATGFNISNQNPIFGASTLPARDDGQGVPVPVIEGFQTPQKNPQTPQTPSLSQTEQDRTRAGVALRQRFTPAGAGSPAKPEFDLSEYDEFGNKKSGSDKSSSRAVSSGASKVSSQAVSSKATSKPSSKPVSAPSDPRTPRQERDKKSES